MGQFVGAWLKLVSVVAWIVTAVSFLIYNFFIQSKGLAKPPCDAHFIVIVWRSSQFCAAPSDARLWQLNYTICRIAPFVAAGLTAIAGAYAQRMKARGLRA